jgi:hypothetical protein
VSTGIRTSHQPPLFIETMEEAFEATAAICGGKKAFACKLRPDLADDPEAAHRWFLDALNPDRRTELHVIHMKRACVVAREYGCHILKHWFDGAVGYEKTNPATAKSKGQVRAERMGELASEFKRLADEQAAETISALRAIP